MVFVVGALVAGLMVGVGVPPALAATIAVTTADDVVDPTDGVISLREAFIIASSNETADTITLVAATEYELDSCFVGELPHTQDESLTVQGNGATIYQTCPGKRVIHNDNQDAVLTLEDVTLTGGFVPPADVDGAGVKSRGPLFLDNVTILFINAGPGGTVVDGGNSFDGDNAAISVVDSTIASNTGDGIYISGGPVSVTNSIVNNHTGSGIALIDGTPVTITGSSVSNNGRSGVRTTGQGFTSMTITSSNVDGNGDTGASCSACNLVTVTNSSISGNGTDPSRPGGGLAIFSFYNDATQTYTVTGSTIDNNAATREGGGIRLAASAENTDFPPATLAVTDSDVNGNSTAGAFDIDGGGIYAETGAVSITNSSVSNNAAGPVGGFTSSKGGGIYVREVAGLDTDASLTVTGSIIDGNDANWQGGGIWAVTAETVSIATTSVSGNAANSLGGGGLYSAGAAVSITDSTIDDNDADTGGGIAIGEFSGYPEGSLSVAGTTISNNSSSFAASGGGGVFVNVGDAGVDATFVNSTISGNSSANFGGGIMAMQTSGITLRHATVVDNTGVNGANLFTAAAPLDIAASIVADPTGGANCDVSSTITGGHSFADDASCGLGGDDTIGVDPGLGPLADNGGPTATHLPGDTAAVAGLVPAAACTQGVDQRGVSRPQGADCEAGSVEISEDSGPNFIYGSPYADEIVGTPGDDIIYGYGGDDHIDGGGGNDIIIGGSGNDTILGGPGDDMLRGGRGVDGISGGPGRDIIRSGPGGDVVNGGSGRDTIAGGGGPDVLRGARGNDVIRGGFGNDRLYGGPGFDRLNGGPGRDHCDVGADGGVAVRC